MYARPASAARIPSSRTAAASSARSRSNDEIGMRYRYHRWHERLLLSPDSASPGCSARTAGFHGRHRCDLEFRFARHPETAATSRRLMERRLPRLVRATIPRARRLREQPSLSTGAPVPLHGRRLWLVLAALLLGPLLAALDQTIPARASAYLLQPLLEARSRGDPFSWFGTPPRPRAARACRSCRRRSSAVLRAPR